jgi:hypothetical protein
MNSLLALCIAAIPYIDGKTLNDALNASGVRQARNEYVKAVSEECLGKALVEAQAGKSEYVCHLANTIAWDAKTYIDRTTEIELAITHYLTYERSVSANPAPESESKKVYDIAIRMSWGRP